MKIPDECYTELSRLKNWKYKDINQSRQEALDKIMTKLILDPLGEGCTENRIKKHLTELLVVMRISNTWGKFLSNFARAFKVD